MYACFHFVFTGVFFKLHNAVAGGENSEVAAKAHVCAGVHFGTELAHDNVACPHGLSAKALDASALPYTVAAVT